MASVARSDNSAWWEHFSHVADIGIRGHGATLEAAFEQAAVALTAVICDPENVHPLEEVHIQCEASDHEILLVDWLNSLIYEMATRSSLFNRYDVQITGFTLSATAWGESVDRERHQPAVETKGATYTALRVAQQGNGTWIAQCVIDV